jgi:hypothetical protein
MKTVHLVGCIKRDVMRWVNRYSSGKDIDLSDWYCGMTHVDDYAELEKYINRKGVPEIFFRRWLANDLTGSYEVLRFFVKNGMRSNPVKGNPKDNTRFIFVFKVHPRVLDDILKILG